MSLLLDRLNRELEVLGKRAQAALDQGRLQMELLRHRRQQDAAARISQLELRLAAHRAARSTEPPGDQTPG